MTITASAPGKLILLGEYAVLEGAPALVAGIDRRATVSVAVPASASANASTDASLNASTVASASADSNRHDDIRVVAADLGIDTWATIAPDGVITWRGGAATASRLHLVDTVLVATYSAARSSEGVVIPSRSDAIPHGYTATLSTAAFFDTTGAKLGLGSSAALTVALAGALRAWLGLRPPTLAESVQLHRSLQGGRGSGADIGAAYTGGVIAYAGGDTDTPTAHPVSLPGDVHWCCVFTGRSTSTPQFLARLAEWRRGNPGGYRGRMRDLAGIAGAGIAATRRGDASATLDALDAYAIGLDALGIDAGIDIMSLEHREIRNAAGRCGVIYKPSGAGGGDIGIGFSGDSNHIAAFRRALSGSKYRIIDLDVDAQGLTVCGDRSAASACGLEG